jgi:hypothetical protein
MIAEESVIDRGGALWHRLAVRIERDARFGMQTPPREPTADEVRAAKAFCFGPERVAVHLHVRQADAARWGDPFTVYLHALLIPRASPPSATGRPCPTSRPSTTRRDEHGRFDNGAAASARCRRPRTRAITVVRAEAGRIVRLRTRSRDSVSLMSYRAAIEYLDAARCRAATRREEILLGERIVALIELAELEEARLLRVARLIAEDPPELAGVVIPDGAGYVAPEPARVA